MDLFDYTLEQNNNFKPLAEKMRPQSLNEFFGQEHLLAPGKVLRRLIENDHLTNMILQGPPSSGKTSLATIISKMTNAHFIRLNGVNLGIADIREAIKNAKDNLKLYNQRTVLFIDEIHAMKSNVQEALLPPSEDGTFTLIGATTESVMHDIIPPLVSRCKIYNFKPLEHDDHKQIIRLALQNQERGLANKFEITEDALSYLVDITNGDVRNSLIALENAAYSLHGDNVIELQQIQEAVEQRINGMNQTDFYDIVSAFCKSLRGSDSDAAVYWMARLLYSGVDPIYIARRMVVHATEDVGMGNPTALQMALAAKQAAEFVGMPECRMALAQAAIFICESPKSNSVYKAINAALETVKNTRPFDVPDHLKDGTKTYINPVDFPDKRQPLLPPELRNHQFYKPQNSGTESKIYVKHQQRSERE
jgi:putative ATPase